MNNYLEIAKRRFPSHCVGGNGRFALYTPSAGPLSKILLFDTHAEAVRQIVDPKCVQVVDLDFNIESALEKMRDPYDPEERRRERRG
jgi:hypothetical protein